MPTAKPKPATVDWPTTLKNILKKLDIQQKQLAIFCGCDPRTMYRWSQGDSKPSRLQKATLLWLSSEIDRLEKSDAKQVGALRWQVGTLAQRDIGIEQILLLALTRLDHAIASAGQPPDAKGGGTV